MIKKAKYFVFPDSFSDILLFFFEICKISDPHPRDVFHICYFICVEREGGERKKLPSSIEQRHGCNKHVLHRFESHFREGFFLTL